MKVENIELYADVVLNLYKGVVSIDDGKLWRVLIENEQAIRNYVERVSLQLHVNHAEGYAYLEQPEEDENGFEIKATRLTRRIQLSAVQTIVLLVLRQRLLDFDSSVHEEDNCMITREDIHEECIPFFQNNRDEKRTAHSLDTAINKIREYGFLKRLQSRNNDVFIVQPVLKSKLNSQRLSELKDKLQTRYTDKIENDNED